MDEENEALIQLRKNWSLVIEGDGGNCPCCDRWGKIYQRGLNSSMSRSLIWLVFNAKPREDGWVHVPSSAPDWMLRNSQLTALKMWGLVTTVKQEDNGTKLSSSGLWMPTEKGRLFAQGAIHVHKYVYVYNDRVVSMDGDQVTIQDCLGDKFNYEEITTNYNGTEKTFYKASDGTYRKHEWDE